MKMSKGFSKAKLLKHVYKAKSRNVFSNLSKEITLLQLNPILLFSLPYMSVYQSEP